MTTLVTTFIVFACIASGGLFGLYLRSVLSDRQWNSECKDVVTLGMGLIGTMSALLLGLELSSAKESYDNVDQDLKQIVARISYLDRVLAQYGPESKNARELLRAALLKGAEQMQSPQILKNGLPTPSAAGGEMLLTQIHQLPADTEVRAALKAEAATAATEIGRIRWMMFAQNGGSHSVVFLIVIMFWLAVVFAGFGMLGTPNATVIGTLILSALSVAVAIGLILELNRPFAGLLRISEDPLRRALELLGQ